MPRVNPNILSWARETAGLTAEEAVKKLQADLEQWRKRAYQGETPDMYEVEISYRPPRPAVEPPWRFRVDAGGNVLLVGTDCDGPLEVPILWERAERRLFVRVAESKNHRISMRALQAKFLPGSKRSLTYNTVRSMFSKMRDMISRSVRLRRRLPDGATLSPFVSLDATSEIDGFLKCGKSWVCIGIPVVSDSKSRG